ncbi:MAG: hypothetical protein JNK15_18690 [Planctomycetes bacterium]|nr:hypothetical protein [Planctomycetota bacterium]
MSPNVVRRRFLSIALLAAATAEAQVTVQVVLAQPLQLQAQIAGSPLTSVTVPLGTDVTNSGVIEAVSTLSSMSGRTSLAITPSTPSVGTTCELVASAWFSTVPTPIVFQSSESGAEFVTFRSNTSIAGVLVGEAVFTPSTGPAMGSGTIGADFGADGSVELVGGFGSVVSYARPVTLGPGQDFVVRVAHQGSLGGPQIGEYSNRCTLRFVPHADGYDAYGPTTGCRPVATRWFMDGQAMLMTGLASPPVDVHVLALGQSQVSVAMPWPSPCPLLTSADLLIAGPFTSNWFVIPPASIPLGAHVYLQFVGLRFATLTAEASRGIHGYGQ